MLILTRKLGQEIVIDPSPEPVTVMVCSIDRWGQVRLGVAAPRDVRVMRGELVGAGKVDHEGERS